MHNKEDSYGLKHSRVIISGVTIYCVLKGVFYICIIASECLTCQTRTHNPQLLPVVVSIIGGYL